jgi:hypothetical protein
MPRQRTVIVTYDSASNRLNIEPLHLHLEPEDWVVWDFSRCPGNATGFIEFQTTLGPFQSLLLSSERKVVATGNTGLPEGVPSFTHPYTALLLTDKGTMASSAGSGAAVVNSSPRRDTSPHVAVHCHPGSGDHPMRLDLIPRTLWLYSGQTAIWDFFNLPPDCFVTLRFPRSGDPLLGPFRAFSLVRGLGNDPARIQAIGEGFGTTGIQVPPQTRYEIVVRDAAGNIVRAHDPIIDSLGEPPPPDAVR